MVCSDSGSCWHIWFMPESASIQVLVTIFVSYDSNKNEDQNLIISLYYNSSYLFELVSENLHL